MDKHASMNRTYRLVWSAARGAWVVASELARGRSKSGRSARRTLAAAAAGALALGAQAYAQVVPATTVLPTGGNTNAYISPNGVPVVNINTANQAGVSHNRYTRYDVQSNGLVLNNGNTAQAARQSQLAGQVVANVNLAAEARVILNEVVAANRSTLAGFTEVLGGRADVVVANPWGITCAGCGFLNTDRVTLTTGTPNFGYDGALAGFSVQRGDILVNGGGLNASAQQVLDLVTRSVKLDGQVNTAPNGSLGIVTGLNQWSYVSRAVTGSTGAADAGPALALDSTALGGMYAGRIRLIATEAGVGVRMLGEAAASADDFTLNAAGRIAIHGKLSAQRDLAMASTDGAADAIALHDANVSARSDVTLSAAEGGAALEGGVLVAGRDMQLRLGSLADAASAAAVTDNNKRYAGRALGFEVSGTAAVDGVSYGAGGALAGEAGKLTVGTGGATLYAGTTLALTAASGDLALGTASLSAGDDLSLAATAGSIRIASGGGQGIQSSAGDVHLSAAATLDNAGVISAEAGSLSARADAAIRNSITGTLHAGRDIDIADRRGAGGQDLDNRGTVLADQALAIQATAVANAGAIQGTAGTALAAGSLVNTGTFVAAATAGRSGSFRLGSLVNLPDAGNARVALGEQGIYSAGDLGLAVGNTLSNQGRLQALHDLVITAADAHAHATLGIANTGAGTLQAGNRLVVAGTADASNVTLHNQSAQGVGAGELALRLGSLDNAGMLQGARSAANSIEVAGTLDNRAGATLQLGDASAGGGTVEAGVLRNAGTLQARDALALNIGATLDNRAGAQVISGGAMTVRGRSDAAYTVSNAGRMQAGGLLDLKGRGDGDAVDVALGGGAVMLGTTVAMKAAAVDVADGGSINSRGNMDLALASLTFGGSGARIIAATEGGGSAGISVANGYANIGAIHSNGDLHLQAPWISNSATGGISALGTLSVSATGGDLANAGALYAGSQLNASASNDLRNAALTGTIDSSGSMSLSAGNSFINNGEITAGQDIAIAAPVFRNEIAGGVPDRLWTPIAWSVTEMYDHYESGYYNEYFHYRASGQRSQYFSRAISPVKPQIIAGRDMRISGFHAGYNSGGVLAASNGTMRITGTGSFTNDDLNLVTEQWKKQWYDWADCGLFWLDCDYHNGVDYAEWRTGSSTAYSYNAGIFARTLQASGFALTNHSSVWGAHAKTRDATGAGSSSARFDALGGPQLPSVDFGGLTIRLPSNPNGYFVVSRDPQARYLVETNPLFDVGANFVGSDYLSERYGYNPDTVVKRLGDANYEAYLIRQQLIEQTGKNILKGYGDEAAQMQRLMDQALQQGRSLGLQFGQAPTPAQLAGLKEDIVWMVETVVGGQKVLAPVVYLAAGTRAMVEGGAVIGGENVSLDVASLANIGGTIRGDNSLDIDSRGDVTNLSGSIKGGDVSVRSAEGSIRNETLASGTGNDKHYATNIGKAAGIEATGKLALDAARDISVKGADVRGGGDVSLAAGNNVSFDTIENKSADTSYGKVGGLFASGVESRNVIAATNVGSGLGAGGNLRIRSGKDTTIAGSAVDVAGKLKVDAGGDFNVLARQDRVQTDTTSTVSGIGVGGGMVGSSETTTNAYKGTNAGSSIRVGGDAAVSGRTMTLQGSTMDVGGSADIDVKDVRLLAGRDEEHATTTTRTTTFLKISSDAGAEASAGASAKAGKGSATATAGAQAGQEFKLAEITTTTSTHDKSTAVVSSLTVGKDLNVRHADRMLLEGAKLAVGGNADLDVKDLQVTTARNTERSTTSTSSHSIGLYIDSSAKAEASAGARGSANSASARAGAEASAEAGSTATLGWRGKQSDTLDESLTNTGADIRIGGNLKTRGEQAGFTGAGVEVGGDLDMQAREIKVMAAEDTRRSTSSSSQQTAGLYLDAGAKAEGSVKGGAQSNMGLGGAGAAANGEARAEASAGLRYEYKGEKSEEGGSDAVVSSFKVGGNMRRKADIITDQGSAYEVGGDFSQEATTVNMLAAKNTSYSSELSSMHEAKIGVYADAYAEGGASASAGAGGRNAAPGGDAGVGYGFKAKYQHESASASESASEAVTVSIKTGGNFSSTAAGKTVIEGAGIDAKGDVALQAGALDFRAAQNTSRSSENSREAKGEVKVDLNVKGGGLDAEYGQEGSRSSSTQAVAGSIKGGNIRVRTTEGDARFEGTSLESGNKIAIDARGDVKFDAARDEASASSDALNADLSLSMSKGQGGDGESSLGGGVGYSRSDAASSTARTSSLQAGGGIDISAGRDASFEGTQIRTGGDASVKAGGDVQFKAAASSQTSSSVRGELRASLENGQDESSKGGSIGAGFEANDKIGATASTVQAGGKLSVSGNNVVSQEARLAGEGGKQVSGKLVETRAERRDTSTGADFDLSVESKTGKKPNPAAAQAGGSAKPAAAAAAPKAAPAKRKPAARPAAKTAAKPVAKPVTKAARAGAAKPAPKVAPAAEARPAASAGIALGDNMLTQMKAAELPDAGKP